jgi:hypothetical protein
MGPRAIHMLSVGVVSMFSSAGLITHCRYVNEFKVRSAAGGSVIKCQYSSERAR